MRDRFYKFITVAFFIVLSLNSVHANTTAELKQQK